MKMFLIIFFVLCFIYTLKQGIKQNLLFIVFSVYFPLWIKVGGKDAFTLTTIFTLLTSFIFFYTTFSKKYHLLKKHNNYILKLLLVSTLISLMCYSRLSIEDFVVQLRFIVGYFAALLLFFLLLFNITNEEDWALCIKVLVIALAINAIISLFIWNNIANSFFDIFLIHGEEGTILFENDLGNYIRPAGVIGDYELYPEIILMVLPLFYFLITGTNYIKLKWPSYLLLFILILGIFLSITRGAIIILCLQILTLTLFNPFKNVKRNILSFLKVIFLIYAAFLLIEIIDLEPINLIIGRFEKIDDSVSHNEGLLATMGREERVADFLKNEILYFGYAKLSDKTGSFHSLLLTHLYKDGYLGTFFFLLFYSSILIYSIKGYFTKNDIGKKYFFFFVLLSFLSFLINEMKVEYLRYSYTIQSFFIVLGLYLSYSKANKIAHE